VVPEITKYCRQIATGRREIGLAALKGAYFCLPYCFWEGLVGSGRLRRPAYTVCSAPHTNAAAVLVCQGIYMLLQGLRCLSEADLHQLGGGGLWLLLAIPVLLCIAAAAGEMSATIMRYTQDWMSVIPGVRATIAESGLADVKVGIGLNFNRLDAVQGSGPPAGGFFGFLFGARSPPPRDTPAINGAAVYDLIANEIDFLGISAYAPYTGPGMPLNEFENSVFNVADSLRQFGNGVNLAALAASGKVEVQLLEFGLGGGGPGNAAVRA